MKQPHSVNLTSGRQTSRVNNGVQGQGQKQLTFFFLQLIQKGEGAKKNRNGTRRIRVGGSDQKTNQYKWFLNVPSLPIGQLIEECCYSMCESKSTCLVQRSTILWLVGHTSVLRTQSLAWMQWIVCKFGCCAAIRDKREKEKKGTQEGHCPVP